MWKIAADDGSVCVGFALAGDADVDAYQRCVGYRLDTTAAQATVWLAGDVQDELTGYQFVQWPIAGRRILVPQIIDGQARWVNPRTDAVIASVGELCHAAEVFADRAVHHSVMRASVDDAGVPELLALAVGDDGQRIDAAIERYRLDPAPTLLLACADRDPVGVVGFTVNDTNIVLLHIATRLDARRTGVGRRLLAAVRENTPVELPLVAETDAGALGFYLANDFIAESLGEKYPGVERFLVTANAMS